MQEMKRKRGKEVGTAEAYARKRVMPDSDSHCCHILVAAFKTSSAEAVFQQKHLFFQIRNLQSLAKTPQLIAVLHVVHI